MLSHTVHQSAHTQTHYTIIHRISSCKKVKMGVPLDMVTLTQYDSRVECFEVRYQDSIVSS